MQVIQNIHIEKKLAKATRKFFDANSFRSVFN